MTRCASEDKHPTQGLGWRAPNPVPTRFDTPRLTIRLARLEEIAECARVIATNLDHLHPWMPWAKGVHANPASLYKFIAEQHLGIDSPATLKELGLGVFLRDSDTLVGGSGIHDIRPDTASAETGYWIAKPHTGKGFAEEACRHLLSWALRPHADGGMGLRRIRIYCSSANEPSARIPEKLGLTAEVRQRQDYVVEGRGPTDRLGWGVLASEWDCESHSIRK
ncbi:MAG: GNAT family protein [Planctomycetota bacterium]